MKFPKIKYVAAAALTLSLAACSEDFLEPEVSTAKSVETSVNTVADLEALVLGAYDRMNAAAYYGRDFVAFGTVRSDDAFANGNSGRFVGPGQFFLTENDAYPADTWAQIYAVIANANIVINAEIEDGDTPEAKYAKGQAYAIRALGHFDLLRLYGQQWAGGSLGVPYITEFKGEDIYPSRNTVSEVYTKLNADLEMAASLLAVNKEETNPAQISYYAVKGLQSRTYLYSGEEQKAADAALEVINSGAYSLESGGWGDGGTLFQLEYTDADQLSSNSLFYIYNATNYGDIEATTDLYTSYEDSDVRKNLYSVDGSTVRMVGKYSSFTSPVKVIRYAEVLLNYAEALVKLSTGDPLSVLNSVATNRGASAYTEAPLANVLEERRKELAFEGFRFFDLVRNGMDILKVDSRQTFDAPGIPYGSPKLAFPIPVGEMNANGNMDQNDDY